MLQEKYLGDQPFLNLTDIEEYGESSVSPVFYLMLESLGEVSIQLYMVLKCLPKGLGIEDVITSSHYAFGVNEMILKILMSVIEISFQHCKHRL